MGYEKSLVESCIGQAFTFEQCLNALKVADYKMEDARVALQTNLKAQEEQKMDALKKLAQN